MTLRALALAAAAASAAAQYDVDAATRSAWYSAAAYCGPSDGLLSWSCGACVANGNTAAPLNSITSMYNASHNVWGYTGVAGDGTIVVAFRGTNPDSLGNWIVDLSSAVPVTYEGCDGCEVADGFYTKGYLDLSEQLYAALSGLPHSDTAPIIVTGHSLGAAMAELAMFELTAAGFNTISFYSFGDPRVGNPAWATAFADLVGARAPAKATPYSRADALTRLRKTLAKRADTLQSPFLRAALADPVEQRAARTALRSGSKKAATAAALRDGAASVFRVTHYRDPVPHLPPEVLGFQHPPTEVWYDEAQDSYTVCSSTDGEDPNCSDSLILDDSISDHLSYMSIGISSYCQPP